jgi:hypothetical protein
MTNVHEKGNYLKILCDFNIIYLRHDNIKNDGEKTYLLLYYEMSNENQYKHQ